MSIHWEGCPSDEQRYQWRRDILQNLFEEGIITKELLDAKVNANRLRFPDETEQKATDPDIPPEPSAEKPAEPTEEKPAEPTAPKLSMEALVLLEILDKSEELALEKLQGLWEKYDTDKNGVLDFKEAIFFFEDLENATVTLYKQMMLGQPKELMASFNKDKENEKALVAGSDTKDFEQLKYGEQYKLLDKDGNGTIDFGEFTSYMKQAVKDSTKTREEMKEALKLLSAPECAQQ